MAVTLKLHCGYAAVTLQLPCSYIAVYTLGDAAVSGVVRLSWVLGVVGYC